MKMTSAAIDLLRDETAGSLYKKMCDAKVTPSDIKDEVVVPGAEVKEEVSGSRVTGGARSRAELLLQQVLNIKQQQQQDGKQQHGTLYAGNKCNGNAVTELAAAAEGEHHVSSSAAAVTPTGSSSGGSSADKGLQNGGRRRKNVQPKRLLPLEGGGGDGAEVDGDVDKSAEDASADDGSGSSSSIKSEDESGPSSTVRVSPQTVEQNNNTLVGKKPDSDRATNGTSTTTTPTPAAQAASCWAALWLKEYCSAAGPDCGGGLDDVSVKRPQLASALESFYEGLSLLDVRRSLQRYLRSQPHTRHINIISDKEFAHDPLQLF